METQPSTKKAKPTMHWSDQLRILLDDVEPLGTFATSGLMPPLSYPLPRISVEGIGRISFPIQAVEPLKAVATKAPFGKGTETLIDDNVRQAWQIDATKITVADGTLWDDYLNNLVCTVCKELGFSDERTKDNGVHANLYKMLLYEQGGHFLPHKDTEKEDGMFGTLAIQLPSEFTGGTITVSHDGETKTFVMAEGSMDKFQYLAFYADCEHQLHPVETGFRCCLVYNLVSKQSGSLPSHAINKDTEAKLRSLVDEWRGQTKTVSKLGYQLEHQYTPSSFHWSALKGRDEIVRQTVTNASAASGKPLFSVHLLLIERYLRRMDFDVELDEMHAAKVIDGSGLTIAEVPEFVGQQNGRWKQKYTADNWIMYKLDDGWLVPGSEYKQDTNVENEEKGTNDDDGDHDHDDDVESYNEDFDDDIEKNNADIRVGGKYSLFKELDAAKEEGGEYCGNESAPREHWYYAAAVVITPT